MRRTTDNFDLPWCAVSDFNSVLHTHERVGVEILMLAQGNGFLNAFFIAILLTFGIRAPSLLGEAVPSMNGLIEL